MTTGKIFLSRIGGTVEQAFKPSDGAADVGKRLFEHMHRVIGSERLMKALDQNHPGETVYFGDKEVSADQAPIYAMLHLNPLDVRKAIKDTGIVQSSWAHANKPLYWTLMSVIRENIKHKHEDHAKMSVMFMAVAMYAGLQFRYFRRFYQPNTMAYAANTLTDKFTLRQEGTMIKALMAIAWRCHQKYEKNLMLGTDEQYLKYLVSMWGRLNGMVKALKSHYEQAKASGQFLNQSREEHEDGSTVERETTGGRVIDISNRITEAFFAEPVPMRLVEMSASMADIPRQSLQLAVHGIRMNDPAPVRTVIRLIAERFFEEERATRDDLRTRNFLVFANAIYTRSNTRDGRVEEIKNMLNSLLQQHSPQFLQTNREATKGAFRKALYLLIIFFIQYQA